MEPRFDLKASTRTLKGKRNKINKLQVTLNDLREELQVVLNEIAAVSSLVSQAAAADRSRSISAKQGDQLAGELERKLTALEKNKSELMRLNKLLDDQYSTMTDMSQELQMHLQDLMAKSQKAIQILANILKNQHETLKAIIQNMKA
jgi:DNA repair exonuclease SbcCD ATPase subunit